MKVVRYQIPKRLELSNMGRKQSVQPIGDDTYQLTDLEDGSQEIWSYSEVLSLLKMSETRRKDPLKTVSRSAARIRDGGLRCRSQLSSRQDDILDFRLALMYGIRDLDQSNVPIYAAGLDKPQNRNAIKEVARQHYVRRPISDSVRGGSVKRAAFMPDGRTLFLYWERWTTSDFDEMAPADQDWKKGNRSNHGVPTRMRELMTQAIEEAYMTPTGPNVASALRRLTTLVNKENIFRVPSGLDPLVAVSHKTLSRHIEAV